MNTENSKANDSNRFMDSDKRNLKNSNNKNIRLVNLSIYYAWNISDVTDFVKKTKLTKLENKIPDVSSLATKTALTAVENKIPSVSSLVKKPDYVTKISELEKKLTDHNYDKYITTPEFNTLATRVFNARLAQANLINY